ncbi:MAG: hypothetical protein KAT46_03020 [Deltaproteobacteria bacterium]|nr:hypothetical protein [Deltaproteobacteria bacterium]
MRGSLKNKFSCMVLILAVFLVGISIPSLALALDGTYEFSETTTTTNGVEEVSSITGKTVSLNLKGHFTRTLRLNADLRWQSFERDPGTDSVDFFPVFSLAFTPPSLSFFSMTYNRTDTTPTEGEWVTNSSFRSTLQVPKMKYTLVPLNFTFNRSSTYDHDTPRRSDSETDAISFNTSHSFILPYDFKSNMRYSYSLTTDRNFITELEGDTSNHSLNVSSQGSFLDKKLSVGLNFVTTMSDSLLTSLGLPVRFEQVVALTQGLECDTCNPVAVGATPAILVDEPELVDNNTTTPANPSSVATSINLQTANWHIGGGFIAPEVIHKVHVYISTTVLEEPLISAYNFGWRVYGSNDNNVWTEFTLSNIPAFDTFYDRFVFSFSTGDLDFDGNPDAYQYYKVVNEFAAGTQPIEVTEVEFFDYLLSTPSNTAENSTFKYGLGVTFRYLASPVLRMGYSLNLDNSLTESDEYESDVTTLTNSLTLSYDIYPEYLKLSSGLTYDTSSTSRTRDSYSSERLNFNLSLSGKVLPTLRGSGSFSFSDQTVAGKKVTVSTGLSGLISMDLYRDVFLSTGARLSFNDGYDRYGKKTSTTEQASYDLGLTARPWKKVYVSMTASLANNTTDSSSGDINTSTTTVRSDFSYNFSRNLTLKGAYTISPDFTQSYSFSWRPFPKIYTNGTFSITDTSTTANASFSWNPFKWLSSNFGYSFGETSEGIEDTSTERVYGRVNMRF